MTPADQSQPQPPLDYATPVNAHRFSRAQLAVGIVATFFGAIGSGLLTAGALIANRMRDDHAAMIATGVGFLTIGSGVVATYLWARVK